MTPSRGRTSQWLWRDDEEMAKKDDDLRTPRRSGGNHRHHVHPGQWQSTRVPRRSIIARRIAYAAIITFAVFALYKAFSLSSSGSPVHPWSPSGALQDGSPHAADASGGKTGNSAAAPAAGPEQPRSYDGPVKFPYLANSVQAITHTDGHLLKNTNILFAAASLRSAAALLPMACAMGEARINYVHFAFVGRSSISMQDLIKVNGIDPSCPLILHDARPTRASDSTESRMTLVAARALYHMNTYMHPQAVLVDSTSAEEAYFLSGFRDQIRTMRSSLIELPDRPQARMSWLAKLDAAALGAWNTVHFDILIHAPPSGSANLRRLLQSLHKVDLAGISIPHLTLELPPTLEKSTQNILSKFQWPPRSSTRTPHPQMLTINRRIPHHRMAEEERSVRFLESFWPRHPSHSHVLILSPQTEVSTQFLHYVKYSLLHQRYSSRSMGEADMKMMGMSFSIPTTYPDASKAFKAPQSANDADSKGTPFLWEAPTSDALLLFGSKWVELHGLVSHLLETQSKSSTTPALLANKAVSKKYPAWMEHVLLLARLRGYYTLYPSEAIASSIIGVHTDLPSIPEEYQDESTVKEEEEWVKDDGSQAYDPTSRLDVFTTFLQSKSATEVGASQPLMAWDGEQVELGELDKKAFEFAKEFRREVGQCDEEQLAKVPPPDQYAGDLFCKKESV